ncbi:unnamed protein product [Peniophora sp. CBMAI 1063]|nr:unnamed protein product [Peniophora sp. CBMAI 1063]
MSHELTRWFNVLSHPDGLPITSKATDPEKAPVNTKRPPSFQTSLTHYFSTTHTRPCHINRLPHELLEEIFSYMPYSFGQGLFTAKHIQPMQLPDPDDERSHILSAEEEEEMRTSNGSGQGDCLAELFFLNGCLRFCSNRYWNFLSIMRVCKRWNATIRMSPRIWSSIPSFTEGDVRRAVELSQSTSLYLFRIESHKDWPSKECFTSVLSSEVARVREIWLDREIMRLADWGPGSIFDVLSSHEAPQLRRLRLLAHRDNHELNTDSWTSTVFPSLTLVDMRAITMSSSCALLSPTLTELVLTDCHINWTSAAAPVYLLARLPLLEVFDLFHTPLPFDLGHRSFTAPSEIVYPLTTRLRVIGLDGSLRSIHRVLDLIQCPPGEKRISLSYRHSPGDVGTAHDIAWACEHIRSLALLFPTNFTFPGLEIGFDLEKRIIRTWSRIPDEGYRWNKVTSNPCITVEHQWPDTSDSIAVDVLSLATRMHEPFIVNIPNMIMDIEVEGWLVNINNANFTPETIYAHIASYLPKTTELRLRGAAAHSFLPWLMTKTKTPIFPPLRCLELSAVNLQECIDVREPHPTHILFAVLWAFLHLDELREMKTTVGFGGDRLFGEVSLTPSMETELAVLLGSHLCVQQSFYHVDEEVEIEVRRTPGESEETLTMHAGGDTLNIIGLRLESPRPISPLEAKVRGLERYWRKA